MNINYKEPQFELFPLNSATLEDVNKPRFLLATLTLSIESLVILMVLAIMIGLLSFSVGVEQGKRLTAQALDGKVAAAWNVGGRRLAVAPSLPAKAVATAPAAKAFGNSGFIHTGLASRVSIMPAKWTVQLATYRNENYAQQEAFGLKAKGYPVFLIKKKDFYFICVGQYGSLVQANAFFKKIQAKYHGSQVRRF